MDYLNNKINEMTKYVVYLIVLKMPFNIKNPKIQLA